MKKSTKVVLTLLVPAMTAYGCSNQSTTDQTSAILYASQAAIKIPMKCSCGRSFIAGGDQVGKMVQCPNCKQTLTVPAGGTPVATQTTPYYSRPYYSPYRSDSSYRGWFGGESSHSASSPPIDSGNHTTGTSHPPSNSHVSSGGFGGTGAHFSGGS